MGNSGSVYVVTHRESGRCYVGSTTRTVHARWADHRSEASTRPRRAFHRDIAAFGSGAFDVDVLGTADNLVSLRRLESVWTILLRATDPAHGYNDSIGFARSAGAVRKGSQKRAGRPLSESHRLAVSAGNKGKPKSPEHCRALSEAARRRIAKGKP